MAGHKYTATITWRRDGGDFARGKYSRGHSWAFDGGIEVAASASPSVVPLPYSHEDAIDPEEAFVAALSSCHMLTFLDIARRAGFAVDAYDDHAAGIMERTARGKFAITKVSLRPAIAFAGDAPDEAALERLHHEAHEACFIANSVTTDIDIQSADKDR